MDVIAQNAASAASNTPPDDVREMLQTRYEDVFELSVDGQTYIKPASLYGVPVAKQGEGTPYWQSNWDSLNAYIAGEQREEDLKARAVEIWHLDKQNQKAYKEQKLRCDNVSKQRKIREVFGEGERPHPNQLAAKRFLPLNGLCEQEIMYHIGCKVSDLCVLASQGYLGMDPWDFYRWRIGRALMERRRGTIPGTQRKSAIRGIVNKLDSVGGSDLLFRDAVIYAAKLQGRDGSYGSKKVEREYAQAGKTIRKARKNIAAKSKLPVRVRASPTEAARSLSKGNASIDKQKADEKARAERRARLAKQSTGYTGVNGYRAASKAMGKKQPGDSGSETAKNDSSDSDYGHHKSSRF